VERVTDDRWQVGCRIMLSCCCLVSQRNRLTEQGIDEGDDTALRRGLSRTAVMGRCTHQRLTLEAELVVGCGSGRRRDDDAGGEALLTKSDSPKASLTSMR